MGLYSIYQLWALSGSRVTSDKPLIAT